MVVVSIIGLIAAIVFPSFSAGIESVRMTSATDSIASFLNAGLDRADRRQQMIEITVSVPENSLTMRSTEPGFVRSMVVPDGITHRSHGSSARLRTGTSRPGPSTSIPRAQFPQSESKSQTAGASTGSCASSRRPERRRPKTSRSNDQAYQNRAARFHPARTAGCDRHHGDGCFGRALCALRYHAKREPPEGLRPGGNAGPPQARRIAGRS